MSAIKLKKIYAERGEKQDSVSLVLWDLVSECKDDKCPLVKRCDYVKTGLCSMETQYLNAVTAPVVRMLQGDNKNVSMLSEMEFLDYGLKCLPLYHDLVRVKMAILALDAIVVDGAQGVRVHPLFREKREIIKAIEGLDITRVLRERFKSIKNVTPGEDMSPKEREQEGNPDLARQLMEVK